MNGIERNEQGHAPVNIVATSFHEEAKNIHSAGRFSFSTPLFERESRPVNQQGEIESQHCHK
ncbi:MAG TPA: hypothetical protein VFC07_08895 [Verrucomicrobiae bacterium]|nr:hypothetical protein [Verrucomicrobiae bacterium]